MPFASMVTVADDVSKSGFSAHRRDSVAVGDHSVRIENRMLQVSAEEQTDISDNQLGWIRRFHRLAMSHQVLADVFIYDRTVLKTRTTFET